MSTITVNEIGYYGLIVSNQSGCTSFDYLFVNFVDESENCEDAGCTYTDACNYEPNATINDGSCQYPEDLYPPATEGIKDCFGNCITDLLGQDYNNDNVPVVGYNGNGICDEVDYIGCTDETACNYNPLIEDGGSAEQLLTTHNALALGIFLVSVVKK